MGKEEELLKRELDDLKNGAINFGYRFINDSEVRKHYIEQIQAYSKDLLHQIEQKQMTAQQASQEAVYLRNQSIEIARMQTSDIGRAIAEQKKSKFPTIVELQTKKAKDIFNLSFENLNKTQQNRVWLEIVKSSGRDNSIETSNAKIRGNLGKGFLLFAGAVAAYNIYSAENRSAQLVREVAQLGGNIMGGAIGGAMAGGLSSGPIGCGIGVFVGGVLGAMGTRELENYFVSTLASKLRTMASSEHKLDRDHQSTTALIPSNWTLLARHDFTTDIKPLFTNDSETSYSSKAFLLRVSEPIDQFLKKLTNTTKQEEVKRLVDGIDQSLSKNQTAKPTELRALSRIMAEEVTTMSEAIIESWTNEKIDGFEKEKDIVQCRQELDELITKKRPVNEVIAKTQELKNKKTSVVLERQKFDETLQDAEYVAEGLSLLGSWTKNADLQKAAIVITSMVGIGQTIGAFAGVGTLAASITPIGGALVILGCLGSILGVFSSGRDDESTNAILESIQQLSHQMNHLRTEMHERFNEVMYGLDAIARRQFDYFCTLANMTNIVSEKLDHAQKDQQRAHQQELSYLETLAKNLETTAVKTQNQNKIDKVKSLIIEITQKRKAVDTDPSEYSKLRAALSSYLTCSGMGIRHSDLTGAACPELKNSTALIQHLDDFPVAYHYGSLGKLYQQFTLKNYSYSPDMIYTYLQQCIKDNPHFQLHTCLTIADLQLKQSHGQNKVFGLEAAIQEFLLADTKENSPDTLIIPLCIQAKWQLILVNKSFQQVSLFTAPWQIEWHQRLLSIIQRSVPKEFISQHLSFPTNIAPVYYGVLLVEMIRRLTNNELYDDLWTKPTTERLEQLYQEQTKLFHPDEKLLATRMTVLDDPINPTMTELFSLYLLEIYYRIYPKVSSTQKTQPAIKKVEVDDVRQTLLALENPYHLYQACCDENLFKILFKEYQEAARELESKLVRYRSDYEESLTAKLNTAAKERLTARFLDEKLKAQFEQRITARTYGNWFVPLYDINCDQHYGIQPEQHYHGYMNCGFFGLRFPRARADYQRTAISSVENARAGYIRDKEERIVHFKRSFAQNAMEYISKFNGFGKIDLYDKNAYTHNPIPCFMLPEQEGNPILPNTSFSDSLVPPEILQAQAIGCGYIDTRYVVDVTNTNNLFTIKIHFLMDKSSTDPCCAVYTTKYNKDNTAINFYEGQEAIWWFWTGGMLPQQQNFPTENRNYTNVAGFGRYRQDIHADYGYVGYTETEVKGTCTLPASSYTKTVDISSNDTHPLMVEIRRRLNDKYLGMRATLNQELSAEFNNQASQLGKALLRFEQAYRILKLFLEFLFPASMSNDKSILHILLHQEGVIYNKQKLLADLSGQTERFVADRIVSDHFITSLQTLCLTLLAQQAHRNLPQISQLEQELLQAYDDFLPCQIMNEPSPQEALQFEQMKSQLLKKKADHFQNMCMHMLDLSPEQMVMEKTAAIENNAFIKRVENTLQTVETNFKAGKWGLQESFEQLRLLCLPAPSSSATAATNLHQQELSTALLELIPSPKKKTNMTSSTEWLRAATQPSAIPFFSHAPQNNIAPSENNIAFPTCGIDAEVKHSSSAETSPSQVSFFTTSHLSTVSASTITSPASASRSSTNSSSASTTLDTSHSALYKEIFRKNYDALEATGHFSASSSISCAAKAATDAEFN